jgi:hypothetical protein
MSDVTQRTKPYSRWSAARKNDWGDRGAAKMARLGIKTSLDLRAQTLAFLQEHSGRRARTITGLQAASTVGLSAPTG